MNFCMSCFVTRPPRPVPGTRPGSMPCSAAIRATTGDTNAFPSSDGSGELWPPGRRLLLRRRSRLGRGRLRDLGGGLLRRGLGRRLGRRGHVCALRRDHRELGHDVDGLTLLDEDLGHHARARARHLGVDLVGGDLEQRLVGLDRLADLLSHFVIVPSDADAHAGA